MNRDKYEKIFMQESERYLNDLDELLLELEQDPTRPEQWGEIHGKIHSIKGMARALGMEKITTLGHLMEEWCEAFQHGHAEPSADAVQAIFNGGDLLRVLVARKDNIDSSEHHQLYSHLVAFFEQEPSTHSGRIKKGALSITSSGMRVRPINEVRVRYTLIEELLGLAQEIQLLEKSQPPLPPDLVSSGLKNWIDNYAALIKVLYFRLTHLRLMSIADFAELFKKSLRDLANEYGKTIRLEIIGGEIQADITILERLREPLVHLFRNCIAHGIESPKKREQSGKPAQGRITVKAAGEKESLLIAVSDDGRGIDRSAIIRHLKAANIMPAADIEALTDDALLNTILRPDYSSSEKTTELSGRGIGMNVVAQAIGHLGGSLYIASEPSKGTTFTIRVPLSLSIAYAITFKLGHYRLSIPTSATALIQRTVEIDPEDRRHVINLKRILGIENADVFFNVIRLKPRHEKPDAEKSAPSLAIGVDGILGNRPLMVLPVGELLAHTGIFAGAGIMENGDISMVLDLDSLAERMTQTV